jgi:hypothetical protein
MWILIKYKTRIIVFFLDNNEILTIFVSITEQIVHILEKIAETQISTLFLQNIRHQPHEHT